VGELGLNVSLVDKLGNRAWFLAMDLDAPGYRNFVSMSGDGPRRCESAVSTWGPPGSTHVGEARRSR
jgi:hypothetical protein